MKKCDIIYLAINIHSKSIVTMSAESVTTCTAELSAGIPGQTPLAHAISMDLEQSPATAADPTPDLSAEAEREGLFSPSFLGLLITQFLGATNDNLFRWLVAFIGGDYAVNDPIFKWLVSWINSNPSPETYKDIAVSAGLGMLVLPFILLAAPAGYFADRFSKRTVIVACKVAEVLLMILGVAVILHGNVWLMFFTLFLMGSHSAIFGPVKVRLDPGNRPLGSHLRSQRLDRHDHHHGHHIRQRGAGYLYEWTKPLGLTNWGLWASTIICVAVTGLITSLPIRRPAQGESFAKIPPKFRRRNIPRYPYVGGNPFALPGGLREHAVLVVGRIEPDKCQ